MEWVVVWGAAFICTRFCAAPIRLAAGTSAADTPELVVSAPKFEVYPNPIAGLLEREEKEVVVVVAVEENDEGTDEEKIEEESEGAPCC